VEWLKMKTLSSNPRTTKKKEKKNTKILWTTYLCITRTKISRPFQLQGEPSTSDLTRGRVDGLGPLTWTGFSRSAMTGCNFSLDSLSYSQNLFIMV
jgi:hypothetical protein